MKSTQRNLSFSELQTVEAPLKLPKPIRTEASQASLSVDAPNDTYSPSAQSTPTSSTASYPPTARTTPHVSTSAFATQQKPRRTVSDLYKVANLQPYPSAPDLVWFTTTPTRHPQSVLEVDCDRLRLRELELSVPKLAERLRLAQQRLETAMRHHGIEDIAAAKEVSEVLFTLAEFNQLRATVPPYPHRRSHSQGHNSVRPLPTSVNRRLASNQAAAQEAKDDELLARLAKD